MRKTYPSYSKKYPRSRGKPLVFRRLEEDKFSPHRAVSMSPDHAGRRSSRKRRFRWCQHWSRSYRLRQIFLPHAEERLVEVEPGIKILCHCNWQQDRSKALTIIVVHGLEGSSESQYMLGIAKKGLAAGMNVVRMNQRNCGGTEGVAPVLYHSGLSRDVAAVAQSLKIGRASCRERVWISV